MEKQISEQIQGIINARKEVIKTKYDKLWKNCKSLIDLSSVLKELEDSGQWQSLVNVYNIKEWDNVKKLIKDFREDVEINIGESVNDDKEKTKEYSPNGKLLSLSHKIKKDYIEVCIMGPVSTGKSVLMQGLTGAPEEVLPTGTGKTTATRTTFKNSQTKSAKIEFFTKEEFRTVLNKYVEQLNKVLKKYGSGVFPTWSEDKDLESFCSLISRHASYDNKKFPKESIEGLDTGIFADEYFKTFKLYINKYEDYKDVLGNESIPLSQEEIEDGGLMKYVSYRKNKNHVPSGDEDLYCKALGVKEVTVNWPLLTKDNMNLGKIALVDSMGIGEAKFLVEEDLLETIKTRVDLAIALCNIENDKDDFESKHQRDKKFIKLLSDIRDRKPEDWIYYLCNKFNIKDEEQKITDETVEKFKKDLWKAMEENSNSFKLNKNYWGAIELLAVDNQPNQSQIIEFFVENVLGHLQNDIEKIDLYFVEDAQNTVNTAIQKAAIICDSILKLNLPDLNEETRNKEIKTETDLIFSEVIRDLNEYIIEVSSHNEEHCNKITKEIFPVLANPEICNRLKIRIPEPNLFLNPGNLDNSNNRNNEADNEHLKKLENEKFRSILLFMIINECNKIREVVCKKNDLIQDTSFNALWDRIIRMDSIAERIKFDGKDLIGNYLLSHKNFFKEFYEESSKAVSVIETMIIAQTDRNEKALTRNAVGRELLTFYEIREDLLEGIQNRIDRVDNENGSQSLSSYFNLETKKIIEAVGTKIKKRFEDKKVYLLENNDLQGKDWLVGLSKQKQGTSLEKAIVDFVNLRVNLTEIVTEQQTDNLLRCLTNVSLLYSDNKQAARSFFTCLFDIDWHLRMRLYDMYISTFKDYKIYEQEMMSFYNDVFAMKLKPTDSKPDAYNELYSMVFSALSQNYTKTEKGKCESAVKHYNKQKNLFLKYAILKDD